MNIVGTLWALDTVSPLPNTGINGSITWFRARDDDDESKYMSPRIRSEEESLALGEGVDSDDFFSLFFIVEFQKFFISLSVRPGTRAAIWDHLLERKEYVNKH